MWPLGAEGTAQAKALRQEGCGWEGARSMVLPHPNPLFLASELRDQTPSAQSVRSLPANHLAGHWLAGRTGTASARGHTTRQTLEGVKGTPRSVLGWTGSQASSLGAGHPPSLGTISAKCCGVRASGQIIKTTGSRRRAPHRLSQQVQEPESCPKLHGSCFLPGSTHILKETTPKVAGSGAWAQAPLLT